MRLAVTLMELVGYCHVLPDYGVVIGWLRRLAARGFYKCLGHGVASWSMVFAGVSLWLWRLAMPLVYDVLRFARRGEGVSVR